MTTATQKPNEHLYFRLALLNVIIEVFDDCFAQAEGESKTPTLTDLVVKFDEHQRQAEADLEGRFIPWASPEDLAELKERHRRANRTASPPGEPDGASTGAETPKARLDTHGLPDASQPSAVGASVASGGGGASG